MPGTFRKQWAKGQSVGLCPRGCALYSGVCSHTILSHRIRDWKTRAAMLWKGVNSIPVHSMVPTRFLVPRK